MSRRFRTTLSAGLAAATGLLAGCSAGGQAWVQEAATPDAPSGGSRPVRSAITADVDDDGAEMARRPVIRLGEWADVAGEGTASVPPPSVSYVTNNYYAPAYGYGYGGYYGWGWDRPSGPPDHHPRPEPSPTPPVGGNWSAPPSYGPPMMTQTLPANPWR